MLNAYLPATPDKNGEMNEKPDEVELPEKSRTILNVINHRQKRAEQSQRYLQSSNAHAISSGYATNGNGVATGGGDSSRVVELF